MSNEQTLYIPIPTMSKQNNRPYINYLLSTLTIYSHQSIGGDLCNAKKKGISINFLGRTFITHNKAKKDPGFIKPIMGLAVIEYLLFSLYHTIIVLYGVLLIDNNP